LRPKSSKIIIIVIKHKAGFLKFILNIFLDYDELGEIQMIRRCLFFRESFRQKSL